MTTEKESFFIQHPHIHIAPHTNNQWVLNENGTETISNAVYMLICGYRVVHPRYAGPKKHCHTVFWRLSTNAQVIAVPPFVLSSRPLYENAVIKDWRRLFETEDEARAFYAKKKASFSKYFKEEFPPVPQEYLHYFGCHGL